MIARQPTIAFNLFRTGRSKSLWCLIACFSLTGCEPTRTQSPSITQSRIQIGGQTASATSEHLARAVDLLMRRNEFEPNIAKSQVLYQLSLFGENLPVKSDWEPDPLTQRLPPDYRNSPLIKELANVRYNLNDADYLLEGVLLKRIGGWATTTKAPSRLAKWFAKVEQERGVVGQQLGIAERLFDWTVRNIQLDPLIPYPTAQVAAPAQGTDTPREAPRPPPMLGIPGPGYQRLPFETLLYGHGDAWERARVFILLARQYEIDAVMLAINEDFSPRARPWVVGVLLGEDLFLFDPELGLPLPTVSGDGIGTLGEYREHPEKLRDLDLDAERKYPATADDLKKVVAFVESAPLAMSQRMAAVESNLSANDQVRLFTRPSKTAEKLGKVRGVNLSQIWTVGCEAEAFAAQRYEAIRQNPGLIATHFTEYMPFMHLNALYKGRHLHHLGRFESTEDVGLGAKGEYLAARANRDELNSISSNEDLQKSMGLVRQLNEPDEIFKARIAGLQSYVLRSKQHASYWLALAHYETGNFVAAIDWFKQRTIDTGDSPWIQGAKYNLARCYESSGDVDKARELLFVDESPQKHGNVLRARWLKKI